MKNVPKFSSRSKQDHSQLDIRGTEGGRGFGELRRLSIGRKDHDRTRNVQRPVRGRPTRDFHYYHPTSRTQVQLHTMKYARVRAFVVMQTCEDSFCRLHTKNLLEGCLKLRYMRTFPSGCTMFNPIWRSTVSRGWSTITSSAGNSPEQRAMYSFFTSPCTNSWESTCAREDDKPMIIRPEVRRSSRLTAEAKNQYVFGTGK